jgi:hypothetical protein
VPDRKSKASNSDAQSERARALRQRIADVAAGRGVEPATPRKFTDDAANEQRRPERDPNGD